METAIQPIAETELTGLLLSGIIAEAVSAAGLGFEKWDVYRLAKQDIYRLNLTPDEYERAIKLLTEALKI